MFDFYPGLPLNVCTLWNVLYTYVATNELGIGFWLYTLLVQSATCKLFMVFNVSLQENMKTSSLLGRSSNGKLYCSIWQACWQAEIWHTIPTVCSLHGIETLLYSPGNWPLIKRMCTLCIHTCTCLLCSKIIASFPDFSLRPNKNYAALPPSMHQHTQCIILGGAGQGGAGWHVWLPHDCVWSVYNSSAQETCLAG